MYLNSTNYTFLNLLFKNHDHKNYLKNKHYPRSHGLSFSKGLR
jgi:hypothetical protein